MTQPLMTEPTDNSDELLELLGAAWDGRLDETSFARLEALLADDRSAACDVLVAFSRLQVELACLAASSQAHERALSLLAPYFAESATAASVPARKTFAASPAKNSLGVRLSKRRFLAVAAGLLVPLAAFTWYSLSPDARIDETAERIPLLRAPHKVARLASADGAVWQDGASYGPGDLLAQGDRLRLLRGTAQVSMVCGADVLMQAPCTVEFSSANRVRLERGKLTAQAARWAKGFVVEAEGLRITDLGTRFAVLAESPGIAEAHVLEGVVRVEPIRSRMGAQPASLLVKAGQAVEWNEGAGRINRTGVDSSRFVENLAQFRPLHPINIANTGRGLSLGSRDPRWRIIAGHASGGPLPAQAVVGRPHDWYLDDGPNRSQWISVRGGTDRGVEQFTQYTFETMFDLSGVDPSTVHLVGQILVDNRVQEIRVNGKQVDLTPWEHNSLEDFQRFHLMEIRDGFSTGVNRLEIDVINGTTSDGLSRNPMALRVEWQAFGCAVGG